MALAGALKRRAALIELVVWDVDGVLTAGGISYRGDEPASENGNDGESKTFNVLDGAAIRRLQGHGIASAIITGRTSGAVARRARELGIDLLHQGQSNKVAALDALFEQTKLPVDAVAHCGDDLPDLDLFSRVGLAISVPNAHPLVKRAADVVTRCRGGEGVAREVEELLLRARGLWSYRPSAS